MTYRPYRQEPGAPANTFLIWTKSQPADFELKLDFRITAGNTGVQYRSQRAPDTLARSPICWVE